MFYIKRASCRPRPFLLCLLPILLISDVTAAAPYARKDTWRETLMATRQSSIRQAGDTEGGNKPPEFALWKRLHDDFADKGPLIMAIRDRMRQQRLPLDSPDQAFRRPIQVHLKLTANTLAYVKDAGADIAALKQELSTIKKRSTDSKENVFSLYLDLVLLRRRIIFSHPALDFDKILINVNPPTTYSHNGDQFLARHSRAGKGLLMLSKWKSEKPGQSLILKGKLPAGAYRSPDLHYDADRLLFAFSDHTEKNKSLRRYFMYEAALDGSSIRQLTGTKDDSFKTWDGRATVLIEDNDPCYLPDDSIIFLSTRSQTFGRCHGSRYNPAWVLHRCDNDGNNIRQLSFGNENEIDPSVLNDGRIAFTRWEYTDRHEMYFHKLWWCRPDGTSVAHLFGNDMIVPHQFLQVAAIPGSHKIVAVGQGHHSYNTGTIVVIDPNIADNGEKAITHITPETSYSESQGWPNPHYSHPYAITEELFLASRANHRVHRQKSLPPVADRGIYLLDPLGGRELIYEDPEMASFAPIAVRKRKRPAMMPPQTPPAAQDWGTVFLQNAYLTRNDPEGKIKPGMIKALRVNALGIQPRASKRGVNRYAVNNIPKKILGTVPVDEDGSAFFKVPARTSLQIQTLDEHGMAIMTERSFFYLQPGENRSCVGCHEPYGSAPDMKLMGKMSRMTPVDLTPPAGPQYKGGLSFMRTVQPVLDRYCIGCHGLGTSKNEQALKLDLINHSERGGYTTPYRRLAELGDPTVGNKRNMGEHARNISRPRDFYAYRNKVSHMLLKNHGNCNMDSESFRRIIEWLDVNSQFYGDLFPNKIEARALTAEDSSTTKELRELIKERFGEALAGQPLSALINKAQVDESRILMAPLAGKAGGWEQLKPLWKSKNEPGYQKMMAAVDACIVKRDNENTEGWEPTLEQGAGERWVMDARKAFRAKHEIKHRFVATDESGKQLLYVDQFNPENDWTISIGKNRDIQVVSDELLIINIPNGYREYGIKTGKMIKEVKHGNDVRSVVRLKSGNTLLASGATIWELDADDKEIRKIDFQAGKFFRLLRLDTDGSYLFTSGQTQISKADSGGTILKTIDLKTIDAKSSKPYFALPLKNGNILISTGYGASLLEIDADEKLVRKIGGRDSIPGTFLNFFGAAEVLENGNIVVANWTGHKRDDSKKGPQLVEFNKDGAIVWTWHDPERAGSLHGVCVIQ